MNVRNAYKYRIRCYEDFHLLGYDTASKDVSEDHVAMFLKDVR